MHYLEITRRYWQLVPAEAPAFVRKRVEHLVKAGFLSPAGATRFRETYMVVGSSDDYDRGADSLIQALV